MNAEAEDSAQPRGAERIDLDAEVSLRRAGARAFRVCVFDASPNGCKVEFIERPAIGERVWVKFDGLEALEGAVRWVDGHVGGVQFNKPINELVFQRLAETAVRRT